MSNKKPTALGVDLQYLSLKIFKDSKLIKTKIFTDDQVSIGSSEGLNLQLEGLSPWHVLIERKQDIFCILDLNSETGTRLNGEPVTEETPLQSGAVIHIGSYEIHFFVGPPVEKSIKAPEPKSAPIEAQESVVSKPAKPSSEEFVVPEVAQPSSQEPVASERAKPSLQESAVSEKKAVPQEPQALKTFDYQTVKKSSKKGFWNTYAPLSQIKNLDDYLEPSIGNLIEVIVCWKERILKSYYFHKSGDVFMGGGQDCQIQFPNMQNQPAYKLLTIASGAQIYLSGLVKGMLFQGKNKSTRTSHTLKGNQSLILKPYEMMRLDFNESLKLYIRLMDKPPAPPLAGLLNLRVSEALALLFALLLTAILVFYGTLYAPSFLADETQFIEKNIRVAQVIFNKEPKKRKVIQYDLKNKTVQSAAPKKPKVKKPRPKKIAVKTPVKVKKNPVKKLNAPKTGKQGKMAAVAKGKGKPTQKIKAGSARPGGSIKTGKAGSSAKTVAPDPTKVGVLGILGGGGVRERLDTGASGSGGLVGLADQYSGAAGTDDSYEGKGLGTRTKELSSGKGSAIQGISGIKTRGKGLGAAGTGRGGLGKRGRMSIEFSSEDIDVTGSIDREAILRVIRRNQNKFQRCYQLSLNQQASLQGNLTMKWMILANGKTRNARAVESEMDSRTLKNCVAGVLESLTFPEPPAGQIPDVRFTFRFYL